MKSIHNKLTTLAWIAAVFFIAPLASYAQERIVFQTNRDGNDEVYSMKTDGTNPLNLTNHAQFDGEPSIAGNGSKIAFSSTREGNLEIYIMNPDGTGKKRLTNNLGSDSHPALNHDGTKIAFVSDRIGGFEIYTMNADGTDQTRVTFANYPTFTPSFSPDGSKIMYGRFDGMDPEIFIMNADGSGEVNITDNNGIDDRGPSFSPDGTKIVYQSYTNGDWDLYVMNVDGSNSVPVTNNSVVNDVEASFSPDGGHIVYISDGDVTAMTAGGAGDVNLTNNPPISERLPAWSPANHAPALQDVTVDIQVNEGGVARLTGVIADEDAGDSHGITVDWGEGSPEFYEFPAGATSFEMTHTYADDTTPGTSSDDHTVLVQLNDRRFGFDSLTKTVTVKNVNPEISNLAITPSTVTVGKAFRLQGSFADAGYHGSVNDEGLTVTINFGDGQTNLSQNVAPGVIDIFHTYAAIGTYTITVKVTDNDLGQTITTIPVVVSPPAPPTAPTGLRVDYIGANRVQIAWTDTSNSEDGFVIERCANRGCANFVQVGQVAANTPVYLDTNLFANTQYYYRVRAFNLGGSSSNTDVVSAKTLRK